MNDFPEVAVADANAETAAIFDRIMTCSGTGTPALIFRHFAVFPGLLDWAWRAIGDEFDGGRIVLHALDAVARTPRVALPRVEHPALVAAGLDGPDRALLAGMLRSYNRMNPMNHGLIAAIRDLIARPQAEAEAVAPLPPPSRRTLEPCPKLPPPVKVRDMPADLQQTVAALGAAIPDAHTGMVPTLYRHLALWPDLLRLLAPGILEAVRIGEVPARTHALEREMTPLVQHVIARARAKGLPPAPLADPEAMTRTLDTFLFAIPHMTVVGTAIEASLPLQ
ncbi:MAG: hypothetical protein GC151_18750 [Betaproteobacteria bacterium]|nr:hypothetical protein [Betaproteobacteria bacterium]